MDSRNSHLLRTLSDSGEVKDMIALLMEARDMSTEGEECDTQQGAGVNVGHDQQVVSSPASETSKDGKEAGGEGESTCVVREGKKYTGVYVDHATSNHLTHPPLSLSSDAGSEIVGDEDEGFDEEFCDSEDVPPARVPPEPHSPSSLNLQELANNPDLQTLLLESSLASPLLTTPFPTSSLLDDIDPGVYMLEAEPSGHSLLGLDQVKSPVHSPYRISTPSPVCANLRSMSLSDTCDVPESSWALPPYQDMDIFNRHFEESTAGQFLGHSTAAAASGYHDYPSPHYPSSPTHNGSEYGLDMLVSDSCLPMDASVSSLTPTFPSSAFSSASSGSSSTPFLSRPITPVSEAGPSVTYSFTVQMHMNLPHSTIPAATVPMATIPTGSSASCRSPSPTPMQERTASPNTPLSPAALGCTAGSGITISAGGSGPSSSSTSPVSCRIKTEPGSVSTCSTQTPLSPTLSSAPSTAASMAEDSDIPKSKNCGSATEGIVHMPFYKLKKILDSSAIPDEDKSEMKTLRRRGKNKIAAKHCRQRKMELINGLQHEVEQLKKLKRQVLSRSNSLQREIAQLKIQCSLHRGPTFS